MAWGTWWRKYRPGGRNVNVVTSQAESDIAGGATFYDVWVEIEPVTQRDAETGRANGDG